MERETRRRMQLFKNRERDLLDREKHLRRLRQRNQGRTRCHFVVYFVVDASHLFVPDRMADLDADRRKAYDRQYEFERKYYDEKDDGRYYRDRDFTRLRRDAEREAADDERDAKREQEEEEAAQRRQAEAEAKAKAKAEAEAEAKAKAEAAAKVKAEAEAKTNGEGEPSQQTGEIMETEPDEPTVADTSAAVTQAEVDAASKPSALGSSKNCIVDAIVSVL